jgi:site-specific recombinase XerD
MTGNNSPKNWKITREKILSQDECIRLLTSTREKAALDLAKGRSTWVRRWMLIHLALSSGLRVAEIAALTIGDLHLEGTEKRIHVRNGKGGKAGCVVIDADLVQHFKDFIAWKKLVGEPTHADTPLLTGSQGKPYTTMALQKQFKAAAQNAGLSAHYSIHNCRHTYGVNLLKKTKNLRFVQKQLRHSNSAVTTAYANVKEEG